MITINYTKTIYVLTDPEFDSIDNCQQDSFLMFPSLDVFNDWWCFYKAEKLEQVGIFNSYQEAVQHCKNLLDHG